MNNTDAGVRLGRLITRNRVQVVETAWSVGVNGNGRLTFAFENGDAVMVDNQDYH